MFLCNRFYVICQYYFNAVVTAKVTALPVPIAVLQFYCFAACYLLLHSERINGDKDSEIRNESRVLNVSEQLANRCIVYWMSWLVRAGGIDHARVWLIGTFRPAGAILHGSYVRATDCDRSLLIETGQSSPVRCRPRVPVRRLPGHTSGTS